VKYFAFLSLAAVLVFSAIAAGATPYATSQTTPKVAIETTFGDITIELFPSQAPITCNNFLQYVNSGFYDGLIIHRITKDTTFKIVQGGGYYFQNNSIHYKSEGLRPPIINESNNGLSNLRATVAMARTNDPNSATSQFYINVTNNTVLDRTPTSAGYCVFGQVVSGMNVVDQIDQLSLFASSGPNDGVPYYLSEGQPYPVDVYKQQVRVCVSPTGSDSTGIGSPDAPFKTIQKGIDIVNAPGHIVPSPATYTGTGNIDLDFKGKAITVRAIEPQDFNTVTKTAINCQGSSTNMHRAFNFHTNEDANSVVKGLTIINGYQTSGGAIVCTSSNPTIKNCTFTNNTVSNLGGAIYCFSSHPTISNCTFSKNIALSRGGAVCIGDGSTAILNNSILWNNAAASGSQIALNGWAALASITITYSDIKEGQAGIYKAPSNPVTWGPGNLDTDPCFVNYDGNNLNLQSTISQWDDTNGWEEGKNNSPCIDAGNPGCELGYEGIPSANVNVRIDMGAAGGTTKASIPPGAWRLLADIDNDGITNNNDFAWFAQYWLAKGSELPADLDRNGIVDIFDLQLLADDWARLGNTRLAEKADFDLNGIVNFKDFTVLSGEWQKSGTHQISDLNGDGIVNIDDLDLFTQVWLQ
jgi:predicted outer membrane repeat protein